MNGQIKKYNDDILIEHNYNISVIGTKILGINVFDQCVFASDELMTFSFETMGLIRKACKSEVAIGRTHCS